MSFEKFTHVFMVRIWPERRKSQGGEELWRGSVEHLQSNEKAFFQDMEKLCSFIVRKSAARSMLEGSEGESSGDRAAKLPRGLRAWLCHSKDRGEKP